MSSSNQLTLAVKPNDDSRFDNYYIGEANQQLVHNLETLHQRQGLVYLWGGPQSGKSHLLQAVAGMTKESFYLSFEETESLHSELLEGLHDLSVVCLDDIHLVASEPTWETALFDLFNRIKESGCSLLIGANMAPSALTVNLPDLKSRLQSMLVYHLSALSDDEKKLALQLRASKRGFELNGAVADYILARAGRSFEDLMKVLDRLDDKTLETQRRLSIPLVRETLAW